MAETIVKTLKSTPPGESFTWAVAGRSTSKLATILDEISGRTGTINKRGILKHYESIGMQVLS